MSDVISIFFDLVQINSPSGHEAKVAKHIHTFYKQLGFSPKIDKHNNVIVKISSTSKSLEPLLLNAHTDTVQPGEGIKPFIDSNGYIKSKTNTILGADNKTAVASIMALSKLISKTKYSGHPLEIVFTTSEESGNYGVHGLDYSQLKATQGFCSDASNRNFGDIIIAAPFYNRFDITLTGKAAHASQPEIAINILPTLTQSLSKLKLGRVNPNTLANVGMIHSGQVVNTIPGQAIVSGEVRSYLESDLEANTKSIIDTFKQTAKKHQVKIKSKVNRENDGFILNQDTPLFKKTRSTIKKYNPRPKLIKSWGCYDANVFATKGIQLINIADGSQNAHTPDEKIHRENLINLVELLKQLVQ